MPEGSTSFKARERVCELQRKLYCAAKSDGRRRFHSLHDKIWRDDVLLVAWESVRANRGAGGVDQVSIEEIEKNGVQRFLDEVKNELRKGTYRANKVRRVYIPKTDGKRRPLGIPTIKDRVVQAAVRLVIEPIFEADFEECSYGFRPNRSPKDASKAIYKWLNFECVNILDADIAAYFDFIPHDRLMEQVSRRIADGYILALIRAWLRAGVLEEGKVYNTDKGIPQGGVISPLLANIYLHQFDRKWKEDGMERRCGCGARLVRYADDFVILATKSMDAPYEKVKEIMKSLGLALKEEKTRIVNAYDGFDFLGFRFVRRFSKKYGKNKTYRFPSHKSVVRVREKIREVTDKRLNSRNKPEVVVSKVNPILVGWANYFAHVNASKAFGRVQRYCEHRLRRYLRYRRHRYGLGYKEIPDRFLYEKLGLENITQGKIHYVMANAASESYRTAV